MSKSFIHIGFAKAGSSTIQQWLSKQTGVFVPPRKELRKSLVVPQWFDFDSEVVHAFWHRQKEYAVNESRVFVASNERLAGNPHAGHFDQDILARRIVEMDSSVHVLIVVREQMSIIASIYRQYVAMGGVEDFLTYVKPGLMKRARRPRFDWRAYQYDRVINLYESLFGSSQVHVLLLEDLQNESSIFFAKLAETLGVQGQPVDLQRARHNIGISDQDLERVRIRNHFLTENSDLTLRTPSPLQVVPDSVGGFLARIWPTRNYGSKHSLIDEVRDRFGNRFKQSNQALADRLGRDLSSLGYSMP